MDDFSTPNEAISKELGPIEIKNKEFKKSVWGYSPEEVIQFLDLTAKLWEKVQKREFSLLERIKGLENEIDKWKQRETELSRAEVDSKKAAVDIQKSADVQSKKIIDEAILNSNVIKNKCIDWLESILLTVEEVEERKKKFKTQFKELIDEQYSIMNRDEGAISIKDKIQELFKDMPNRS